jgi:thiol-disulfide isomerase/thioredoxin
MDPARLGATRALAIAVAVLAACAQGTPRPAVKIPPLAGRPLAVSAPDLSGREVQVGAPGQVVVVDFFASWCEPCRVQLPHLGALARELGREGLVAYGVSVDDERAAAEAFVQALGVEFPVLWDPGGDRVARKLDIERLPTTLLVDRRGVIRRVHVGYDAEIEKRIEADVKALLAEERPATSAAPP